MTIRVQYHDGVYDIIAANTLQRLIVNGKIKKFYRYSEKRWITVGADPIRSKTQIPHGKAERRAPKENK
ncbi:MAG: GSU3473 family protein [Dissulfurispiraceae bacterium]